MKVPTSLFLVLSFPLCFSSVGSTENGPSPFIRYYEGLSYSREALEMKHQRAKRAIHEDDRRVSLDFTAYHRHFQMRLKPDISGFTEDFQVHFTNRSELPTLSHLYSGELEGDANSSCHGSLISGRFEGFIQTSNGTFYVEPVSQREYHSVIYHQDDVDHSQLETGTSHFCEKLQRYVQQEAPVLRSKRTVDYARTSCLMYLRADFLFFKRFGSTEAVVAQIANYLRAVNDIYDKTNFDGIRHINFKVKTLNVISEDDPSSPQYSPFIGPEKLLMMHSETNWNSYCLSFLLTNRDYSGVLGLAWEGKPGNSGGICSKYDEHTEGSFASLNTGLVTLQKYGHYLPPRLVHLTLAHELGHSLGSPHDEGQECVASSNRGNYLMFPYASDGSQENNNKFSPCTIKAISGLLMNKKDQCFVESGHPICGNQIVEAEEECDVGANDQDPCCYSAKQPESLQCKLKPQKQCSHSQGQCCSNECIFKPQGQKCQEESECAFESKCVGTRAACPPAPPKANLTICNFGTKVCINGICARSICLKYGLEQCDCLGTSLKDKCNLCCQKPGNPDTCVKATTTEFSQQVPIPLPAGTPCSDRQGYCDKLSTCRLVDADGPLARLKNSFLHLKEFRDVAEWMKAHWWVILIAILTLSALMASTVFLFGHTEDSETELEENGRPRRRKQQFPDDEVDPFEQQDSGL
ncbi:disintegrin and metalloproteinase domain-containing protein 10 isoform X1 [Polypterus senegalus]|nr:disintegrin and metalloproteinase domain-containing protein 10 isoform X1 [Polypterus senegalus]